MTRDALAYIERNYLFETVIKHPDRAEATRPVNFPYAAIEEAVVNVVYHHSYEERKPIEAHISHEKLAILHFPGQDRTIRLVDFEAGRAVSRRYRNRRISKFLKELDLAEERSTSIPKILKVMAANGSPAPLFETVDGRASFVVRLQVHPLAKQPTTDVTVEVAALLQVIQGHMPRPVLQAAMWLRNAEHFRKACLVPTMTAGYLEMTLPDTSQH